jgi:hypothetical protein
MKAACTFVLTSLLVSGISISAKNFLEPPDTQKTDLKLPSPEESAAGFSLPEGFKVNVFAAEPDVRQPIAMTFDDRGRLWVAECYTYADRKLIYNTELRDRIVIFEDTDGDGKFDKRKDRFIYKRPKARNLRLHRGGYRNYSLRLSKEFE